MIRNSLATARFGRLPTIFSQKPVALGSLRCNASGVKPSTYQTRRTLTSIRSLSSTPASSSNRSPNTSYLEATHTPSLETACDETKELLALGERYLLPVYARPPFVMSHGEGSWVWDLEGRKYLDFCAGIAVNALGHGDEGMAEVLRTQAPKLLHSSNVYHNPWAPRLAELLVELTRREGGLGWPTGSLAPPSGTSNQECGPGELSADTAAPPASAKVFFSNSGTEANEGALKIARKLAKERFPAQAETKTRIVCFQNAFHGRTMGALSVTPNSKYQAPFRPLIPGVKVGRVNDVDEVGMVVDEDVCAVIVEPIQGEGGVNAARQEWLRELRKRCDEVGATLIFDEVQCGLYRTGSLWAHSTFPVDCHPDIVTMAKPLAGGYPIGAVLMRDSVAQTMTPGTHGTTFGGSPLACALGHHVLSRVSARPFVSHITDISTYLLSRLERLSGWFPDLLEPSVRGRGLILGLGFKNGEDAGKVVGLARERGLLVLTAGKDAVRLVPSLNVGKEEVDFAVDVLESCLSLVARK